MKYFSYSMEKSFVYMTKEIEEIVNMSKYAEEERSRLFYACGTCLHWILDMAERVELAGEEGHYMSAFRFANNVLKHDAELFEMVVSTGGISFPIVFPLKIEKKEIRWKKLCDNGRYEKQFRNYEKYLKGKPVIEMCKRAIEILNAAETAKESN